MPVANSCPRKYVCLSLPVICAILSLACATPEPNSSNNSTPVLSGAPNTTYPMPPFKADASGTEMGWTSLEGDRVKLADFYGKVLVLDFYATWCAPCRKSIPHLNQLQHRIGPSQLQIVGLNVGGPDDRVKVADFARELEINYQLGFPDKSVTDLFLSDNSSIPQTFVFDRNGQLVNRLIGYGSATPGQLEEAIQTALASEVK